MLSAFSEKQVHKSFYFPSRTKIIGVYDEDSVLRTMNGFVRASDSLKKWDKINVPKFDSMDNAYIEKINEFNRDSIKWSPLFKAIKRKDLYDMVQRNQDLANTLNNDRHFYSESLFHPLHEKISNAAMKLQKENNYDSVMNKVSFDVFQRENTRKLKQVNVTLKIATMVW
ncbi:MAG TPA: OmpH family outer membrane protein [Bacteroidia bacterium]|nr:OmpH family outer membrane protein [Bacteroidia bacterium]